MTLVVIASLEGVLADNSHRQHLFKAGQWDEYEEECVNDLPYQQTIDTIRTLLSLEDDTIFVVVSGRYQRWDILTHEWMSRHKLYPDWVLYRDKYDIPKTKEPALKMQFLEEIRRNYGDDHLFLALDHKDDVVEAYRNAGIECWQVRNGVLG